jgi:hypothetical protein
MGFHASILWFNGVNSVRKEVISIRQTIPANTVNMIITERIKSPGTLEEIRVRFYPGVERDLHVYPSVQHKGNKTTQMLTFPQGTEQFLSGDDDYLILPVVLAVDNDDNIKIMVTNVNTTYDYTLSIDVVIDYYGGKNRVTSGGVM